MIAIFSSHLLARRKALGLTQAALSIRAGISIPTVKQLEAGGGQIASLEKSIAAMGLVWGFTETVVEFPGMALARMRQPKRLSQRTLARRLGVSQQTIVTLETRFSGSVSLLSRYLVAMRCSDPLRDPREPQRRLVPGKNDPISDIVMTPRALALQIMDIFAPIMDGVVLEPARGHGAFYDAIPAHVEKDWCELAEGRDFFGYRRQVSWVITNPPFSLVRPFLRHAMGLSDNIVFLCPLTHFCTKARLRDIAEAGFGFRRIVTVPQPLGWPSSGFQLAAVHLRRSWTGPCALRQLEAVRDEVLDFDTEALDEIDALLPTLP